MMEALMIAGRLLNNLATAQSIIKGIKFQRNYGKSAALNEGFKAAKAMLLLPWMPICRIRPMKFLICEE